MADSLQSMIANRMQGETRARLQRFYIEQGYSPEIAAAKAAVEMANRDREARINGPEAGFTGRQGDIVERASRLSAQEPGYYGEQGQDLQQSIYRADPRRLGMDQPATPPDLSLGTSRQEYINIPRAEVARGMPQMSSAPPVRNDYADTPNQLPLTPGQIAQYVLGQAPSTRTHLISPNAEAEAESRAQRTEEPWYRRMLSPMPSRGSTQLEDTARDTSERISRELGQQPGYVAPRESTSAPANRLIDSAMSVVTGQPIAQTQPSPQTLTGQAATAPAAPAVAPAEEVTEPGFYGEQGRILQQALDASRAATQGSPARATQPVRRAAPAASAAAPQQAAAQASQPWYSRLFSGPEYQSTGQQVIQRSQNMPRQGEERPMTRLNWGDSDSAADFFRADRARQELEKNKEEFTGMNRGGVAGGKQHKDAVVMKALEIIHHMLRTR